MDIAKAKRRENIAEYILYLWQLEDLLRALQFSPEAIFSTLIAPRKDIGEEQKHVFLLWYMDLANLLRQEGKEEKGHLEHTLHLIQDLHDLHLQLMKLPVGAHYRQTYARLEPELPRLRSVLLDILDTPVSPELLPANENDEIAQETESLVGPYELHDFYLYYALRFGFSPAKIYRLAQQAMEGRYTNAVLLHWLKNFYRRFFQQQFKRSCLPDGPKIGTVTLSPRGDWRMPSDACAAVWQAELDGLS